MLFGESGVKVGTAIGLIESKSSIKILDKISVNVAGVKNLSTDDVHFGIGIEKNILNIGNVFDIGAGVYMTKSVKDMFSADTWATLPEFNVGISGTWRF